MADERHDPHADAVDPEGLAHTMAEVAQNVVRSAATNPAGLDRLRKVPLTVTVELGRTRMRISEVLNLRRGSVVELSRLASEPVDIRVNGTLFARGEVVVDDGTFAIKILEILEDDLGLADS